jgi:IS30 family transposase
LREDWSPEQISGRLKLQEISGGRKYRAKTSKRAGVDCIPNRTDISERPAIIDEILRIGDWEGDSAFCKTKPAKVGAVFT